MNSYIISPFIGTKRQEVTKMKKKNDKRGGGECQKVKTKIISFKSKLSKKVSVVCRVICFNFDNNNIHRQNGVSYTYNRYIRKRCL